MRCLHCDGAGRFDATLTLCCSFIVRITGEKSSAARLRKKTTSVDRPALTPTHDRPMRQGLRVHRVDILSLSGGASYGAKGLKPPPPDFCIKWCFVSISKWQLSLSAITEGQHLTVKCKNKRVWRPGSARTRWGAHSAPQTP